MLGGRGSDFRLAENMRLGAARRAEQIAGHAAAEAALGYRIAEALAERAAAAGVRTT